MNRNHERLERWCSPQGIEFETPEAGEEYKKRAKRIADVIRLEVPDRVPVVPSFGMFPALDNGYTCEEVMFGHDEARHAWRKTLTDFEPDTFAGGSAFAGLGPLFELIDYKQLKLPGRGIPATSIFQFVEDEYVTADELYPAFLEDPSDFMLRVYLPRIIGAMEPLKGLNPLHGVFGYYLGLLGMLSTFGNPEVAGAFETLHQAGLEVLKIRSAMVAAARESLSKGFPNMSGGISHAPFDTVGDFFRGTTGIMLDMYRHPDELIALMEKLVPIMINMGLTAKRSGNPMVFIPLHKGAMGFMSNEQYEKFYWPTLRKVMMGFIEEGLVPMPLFEGEYTDRLEIIQDIPKASAIYWFEKVDLNRARETLGGTVCFRGNVPVSLLCTATPEEVRAYVKNLIDVLGKDGGLMVDFGAFVDDARHENVKAMVDFAKEYGTYSR